jgi:FkbM family methyltransferase
MTFISYAQNFEDVMLWRALKHIESGFYIDAGAWSPDEDSVTRAFYERGWHGINIEPNPFWFDKLCEKRPKDINLPVALSDKEQTLNFYIVVNITGHSTTDLGYVEKTKEAGQPIEEVICQALPLNKVWDQYVGQKQVHFLKIDVEGAEEAVLLGNNWVSNRPWIVLIESTYPDTQVTTHQLWESHLLNTDYFHVYSDGINRYYLAKEHSDLATAFTYPPNLFDEFKLSSHAQAETNAHDAQAQLHDAQMQLHDAQMQLHDAQAQLQRADLWLKEAYKELQIARQAFTGLRNSRLYKLFHRLGAWQWLDSLLNQIKR